MENMLPGNSFPQICVVSVNQSVGKASIRQQYIGSVYQGNHNCLPKGNAIVIRDRSAFP
jgi:hypothetical protein